MPMFEHIKGFRFWCHKVIPLIYDDSLSYYEFLCKVMQKLNEAIDLLNAHSDEIERFETDILAQFEAFKSEVQAKILAFENLFVEDFSEDKNYLTGDYVLENDTLYTAKEDITAGPFDSTKWDAVIFAADFASWRREMNARVISFITQISTLVEHWLAMLASPHSTTKEYTANEIVNENGTLYVSTEPTTGDFDPTKWEEVILADWVSDNIRRMDEAIDSMNLQIANINRDKADITNSQIVSVEKLTKAFYTVSTDWMDELNLSATENILVYVYSVVEPDTTLRNWFRNNFQNATLQVSGESQVLRTSVPQWIGNSAFIMFRPFPRDNVTLVLHFAENPPQSFELYRAKYEVSPSYNKVQPDADTIGYGFVDVNNIAMDYVLYRDLSKGQISELRNNIDSDVLPRVKMLEGTRAVKDSYGLDNELPYSGTGVDRFTDTTTYQPHVPGPAFYVHALTEESTALLYNQAGFVTLKMPYKNAIVGVGTNPAEAFSNTLNFRRIETQTGIFWYVPLADTSLTAGQRVFVIQPPSADITAAVGLAIITTGLLDGIGDNQGQFGDVSLQDITVWLDSRVSKTEEQLGGYSIVALTQAEYDALDAPDAHTFYPIVG